jgi:hypothetical protein
MRKALLYPSINLTNIKTIKTFLLLYDDLYRIVPEGYRAKDDPEIEDFIAEYGKVSDISPAEYAIGTSLRFKKRYSQWSRTAAVFNYEDDNHFFSWMRSEKIDEELRNELISNGLLIRKGDWLEGKDDVIRFYMYYLANEISKGKDLTLLSDKISSWTVEEFVRHDGHYYNESPREGQRLEPHQSLLLNMLMENYIPSTIENISFREIIEFQDDYRNERDRLLEVYEKVQRDLSLTASREDLESKIERCGDEIKVRVEAYRHALANIQEESTWGELDRIAMVSTVEGGPSLLQLFDHEELAWSSLGIFLGVSWILSSRHDPKENVDARSPFSYLYYIRDHNFHEVRSLNRKLSYKVDELVCD